MDTDSNLLARYAESQDAEAFAEIVGRHSGLVYATALRVVRNAHDAEDVAQTCFIELAKKAGAVRKSLPGWLHSLAISRATDAIRARASRQAHEKGRPAMSEVTEPTWEDISTSVDHAVARLPDDLRVPIILRFLQGRTQGEVARELDVNQSTVSRRIEKGIKRLRRALKKTGIIASATALTALLSENAVVAAPASLTTSLGKIALAGIGEASPRVSLSPAANSTSLGTKAGLSLLAIGTVAAAIALRTSSRPAEAPAREEVAPPATSPPPPADEPKDDTETTQRPMAKPALPFKLVEGPDGLETEQWRRGSWGNSVEFEIVEMDGRGEVLGVYCEQGPKPSALCFLAGKWDAVERPFFTFDFHCEFDHEVPVAMGVRTNAYFESSLRRPIRGQAFTRAVYDLSQHNFKTGKYDWAQGVPIEQSNNVGQIFIHCFPQRPESRAGVLLLDNIRLSKGVFDLTQRPRAPFVADPVSDAVPGDFDNDGTLDRLVLRPRLALDRGNGDGSYSRLTTSTGLGTEAQAAAWADLDRDGRLDLVATRSSAGPLRILLGNGGGSFADATDDWVFPEEPIASQIERILAFDMEPDGDPDLWLRLGDGSWLVCTNNAPRGPSGVVPLSVSLEGAVNREHTVTLHDAQEKCYGARLLEPHVQGVPTASSRALYVVPPGEYTVSVYTDGRRVLSSPVHLQPPGQQVVVTPTDVFALWPKRPVKIDGDMTPGEWDRASTISHTLDYIDIKTKRCETHPMTIWYCADSYALYVCVKVEGEDLGDTKKMDMLSVYFDNNGDGTVGPGEDVKAMWAHIYNDYYRLPKSHRLRTERDPLLDGLGAMSHSTGGEVGDYIYEFMVPWSSKDANDFNIVGDATLGIKIVFAESLRKGFSWRYGPNSFSGYPDGLSWIGENYAKLAVTGLGRDPGVRPGPVSVRITSGLKPR